MNPLTVKLLSNSLAIKESNENIKRKKKTGTERVSSHN